MFHALPVAAAIDGTFTLTDRTEVRVRDPDPVTNRGALDLDTLGDARLLLEAPHNQYALDYLPRLSLLDVNGAGIQPALVNTALVSAEWHTPRVRVLVTESASYGSLSFESLSTIPAPGSPVPPQAPGTTTGTPAMPGTPATPGGTQPVTGQTSTPSTQLVPPVQTLLYESSTTTLSSALRLRPWTLTASIGYQLSGGADASAQATLPFQHGPLAQATADLKVAQRDRLVTIVSASETTFSTGTDDLLAEAEEQWRHLWTHSTETLVGAGLYEARTRTADNAPFGFDTNPVAEAAIDQHFDSGSNHVEIRLDGRLAPIVNRLTGLVDQRVQGVLEGRWGHRRVSLRAFGTVAESVPQGTTTSNRILTGEVDVSYRASEALSFDVGARALFQEQNSSAQAPGPPAMGPVMAGPPGITETTFTQGVVFLAMTVRAVRARF